jgi:hypothetical protein
MLTFLSGHAGHILDRRNYRRGPAVKTRLPLAALIGLEVLAGVMIVAVIAGAGDGTPASQESIVRWAGTVTVRFSEKVESFTKISCPFHKNDVMYHTDNSRSYEAIYTLELIEREHWMDLQRGQVAWTFNEAWKGNGPCSHGVDYVHAHLGTSGTETMAPRQAIGRIWTETEGGRTVERYNVKVEERKDMGGDWVETSDTHIDDWPPEVKTRGNRLRLPNVLVGSENPSIPGGWRKSILGGPWETLRWGPFKLENKGTLMQHSWGDTIEATTRAQGLDRTKVTHTAHVSWDLRKVGEEPVVVEVTPVSKNWRPKWTPASKGNDVGVGAAIVKPEGAEGIFRFTLYDISSEPGWCMNGRGSTEPDLDLDPIDEGEFQPKRTEGAGKDTRIILETRGPARSAEVKVTALDNGAYGRVMVEAKVGEIWYRARVQDTYMDHITIPRDDNLNHIADGSTKWDLNGAPGEDDKDSFPDGDGTDGDGLSNYEEYRGFYTWTGWEATNPKIKDLFIIRDSSDVDISGFAVSGLGLHPVRFTDAGPDGRVINFNYAEQRFHVVDQHGIRVRFGDLDDPWAGTTYYVPARKAPQSPDDVDEVVIDRAQKKATKSDLRLLIAHELGHSVAIKHHGDGFKYVSGADLKAQALVGSASNQMLFKRLDDNSKYMVALWRGEYSGNTSCMMRYDAADLYRRDTGLYYPCPSEFWKAGKFLCLTQDGTDFNAGLQRTQVVQCKIGKAAAVPMTVVLPMCGDGTADKGCYHQIHVTDAR